MFLYFCSLQYFLTNEFHFFFQDIIFVKFNIVGFDRKELPIEAIEAYTYSLQNMNNH